MPYVIPVENLLPILLDCGPTGVKKVLVPLRDRNLIRTESQILPDRLHDLKLLAQRKLSNFSNAHSLANLLSFGARSKSVACDDKMNKFAARPSGMGKSIPVL